MIYIPLERAFQDESIDICHVKNKVGPKSFVPQRRAPNGVKMLFIGRKGGINIKSAPFETAREK